MRPKRPGPQGVRVADDSPAAEAAPAPLNVVVLGMHRSGTSAVAEALRAAGLDAGPESSLMDPEPQNPMGFGERLDVALFNDRLLASLEWFWDAPDPTPLANPPARPELVAEGRALVKKDLAGPRPFMIKDPRISLLLPWWRQILFDRFVPVVVLRDPEEVAWSLNVRDGFPIELGLALWAAYHRHLAAGLDGMEWIGVDYATLCDKPRAAVADLLRSLATLGVEAPVDSRAGAKAIRPLLRRATQPKELAADPEVIDAITALRAQWPSAAVSTAAAVGSPTPPSEWERAILRVHRQTRQAMAREGAARAKVGELEARFATLSSEHAALQGSAELLREDGASIRRQLEAAYRERDAAQTRISELEARASALGAQRADIERGAAQLRSEIVALRQQAENVSRERDLASTMLSQALDAKQAEYELGAAELRQAAEDAARDRDAAQIGLAELEQRLAALSSEHRDLHSAAAALREQVENLSRERDVTRSSLAKAERVLEKQRSGNALLRQQLKYVGRERDAALAETTDLVTRLGTLDEGHQELSRVASELRSDGALLRQQADYVARERDAAQASLTEVQARLESLTTDHRDLESRVATLLAERVDSERIVSGLRTSLAELQQEASHLRAESSDLRGELKVAIGQRDKAQESSAEQQMRLEALGVDHSRLIQTAAGLRQQLADAARERDTLTGERDWLANERERVAAEHDQQLQKLLGADAEIHVLRVKAGDLETQLASVAAAEAVRAMQKVSGGRSIRSLLGAFRRAYRRALVHLPQSIIGRAWHNPLFDGEWYLREYPDVAEQRIGPELHYRLHGVKEARNPNPLFETGWYLGQSPDVFRSGMNPLDHYFLFGAAEGRDSSPLFSTGEYVLANPDVAASGMNPLLHYLRFGIAENRPTTRAAAALQEAARAEEAARTNPERAVHVEETARVEAAGASVEAIDVAAPANDHASPQSPAALSESLAAALPQANRESSAEASVAAVLYAQTVEVGPAQVRVPTPVTHEPAVSRVDHSGHGSPVRVADDVRVIAFYRSSFYPHSHPSANAELGSSEWLAVARARPTYPNHQQPRVPGELGFYDLRLPDTRHDQSDLARSHGINAFCYLEAWGYPNLHTQPFRDMLTGGQPDFPFTLCLTVDPAPTAAPAVTTLTVKWLKANVVQLRFALQSLSDPRAVKVGADPVLLVEGLGAPAGRRVSDFIRQEALGVGLPGIFLVAPTTTLKGTDAAAVVGVDAYLAMHPNRNLLDIHGAQSGNGRSPHTTVVRYDEYVTRSRLVVPSPVRVQTVLVGWDDTPLKGQGGLVLTDATPESYGEWLRSEVSTARDVLPRDRRFVFVSSWNDWARGAYLEPDIVNGRAYLESTRASLASAVWALDEQAR